MPLSQILNIANMSFKAIRENKILAKIYGFTVNLSASNFFCHLLMNFDLIMSSPLWIQNFDPDFFFSFLKKKQKTKVFSKACIINKTIKA